MTNSAKIDAALEGLSEKLAAIEHERWAHWQMYMHSKCQKQPDGSLMIPAELVNRWEKQAGTDFAHLSDKEKASDREQVDRYLPVIADALKSHC